MLVNLMIMITGKAPPAPGPPCKLVANNMRPLLSRYPGIEETVLIDLCAGAGGPSIRINEYLNEAKGVNTTTVLTDIFPYVRKWNILVSQSPRVTYCPEPVDALDVPTRLTKVDTNKVHSVVSSQASILKVRTVFGAIHHFPPSLVGAMITDCIKKVRLMVHQIGLWAHRV